MMLEDFKYIAIQTLPFILISLFLNYFNLCKNLNTDMKKIDEDDGEKWTFFYWERNKRVRKLSLSDYFKSIMLTNISDNKN